MNKTLYSIIFFLITLSVFGQIPKNIFNEVTEEKFDSKKFTNSSKTLTQNIGVYHFGDSESEWNLVFFPYNESVIIQIWNGTWAKDQNTNNPIWLQKCQTFNDVKVKDNKFYFGIYSGQFVEFKGEENSKIKSVLLFSDPIKGINYKKDSAEVGFYSTTTDTFFDDKERYQLSLKIQPESYFINKTKQELKVLRNTIFANYGLIFQKGGEMDKYFRKREWYQSWQKDVSNCLTEIEKKNLETIKKFE